MGVMPDNGIIVARLGGNDDTGSEVTFDLRTLAEQQN